MAKGDRGGRAAQERRDIRRSSGYAKLRENMRENVSGLPPPPLLLFKPKGRGKYPPKEFVCPLVSGIPAVI